MLFSRNTERESAGRQEQHSIGHNLSEHRAHEERRDGSRRHVCGLPTTPTTYLFMSTSRLFVRRWSKLFIARCPAGTDRSFGLARKRFSERTYSTIVELRTKFFFAPSAIFMTRINIFFFYKHLSPITYLYTHKF